MGVDISVLIQGKEIEILELSGRKTAMDAFNIIYQFLSIIRDRMTGEPLRDSKGRITSHLSGLMYRNTRFIENGIKPVYVFDGKPPAFKHPTIEKRAERKEEAKRKWEDAVKRGEPAIKYAQAATKLTDDMVEDAKRLLTLMGIPHVQAPSEGELQCAFMCQQGDVWTSGSQDFDSVLAGSPRLVRNLSITGKRKVPNKEVYVQVKPELIDLDLLLDNLQLTQRQLVILGILVGTDYSDGVKGVGPKTALKLVREHQSLGEVLKNVTWESDTAAADIYDFFLNPPVTSDYDLEWTEPDAEGLKRMMVDDHNFSEDRVNKVIERLQEMQEKGRQSSLSGWLDKKNGQPKKKK
jgi:flap endonuclease-1